MSLLRKIKLMVSRVSIVSLKSGGQGKPQTAQIVDPGGAARDDVEYFEPAGFTSAPPAGESPEGLLLSRSGDLAQAMLVCVGSRKYIIPVEAGEAAMFNMPHGDFIKVRADRVIELKTAVQAIVDAPAAQFTGNVTVLGSLQVIGSVAITANLAVVGTALNGGVNIGAGHTHNENNVLGGPTGGAQ